MQTKHSIHHGHLILLNGKLEHRTPSEKTKYQDFIKDFFNIQHTLLLKIKL